MPVIKYTGTQQRWPELAVTGRQSVWSPGQMEDRTAAEAASLIAAGNFELVGGDLVMLPITTAELASPSEATLRNVNALWRSTSGGLYRSNGVSLQAIVGAALYASVALTATTSGKRIALGASSGIRLSAASAGTIAYRFVDASTAIAVATTDVNQAVGSTPVDVGVPYGSAFLEYIRVGGADVSFTLGLLR